MSSLMQFEVVSPQFLPRMLYFGIAAGEVQVETVTAPSFAASAQADFLVISNVDGTKEALWLDKDADGTEPTAAEYLACPIRSQVAIVTGNTAAQVAAAIVAASQLANITLLDNTDGTFDVTQDVYGDCENIDVKNADGSGAGSISSAVGTEGADPVVENGKFDAVVTQASAGLFTVTFDKPFLVAPEVGVTVKTDNRVARVVSSSVSAVVIDIQNLSGGASIDGSFSLIVLGSDRDGYIL